MAYGLKEAITMSKHKASHTIHMHDVGKLLDACANRKHQIIVVGEKMTCVFKFKHTEERDMVLAQLQRLIGQNILIPR